MTESTVTQIIERLKELLDPARVRWREASKGEQVPYLEGYDMIATANDIFGFRWSFDIGEPQVRQWERTLTRWDKGKQARLPILGQDGRPLSEGAGIAWVTGRVTVHLDGQSYVHADVGRCTFTGDTPEVFDTAISGCVTDCLKRCLRQLGRQFGNELYDKASRADLRKPARKQAASESAAMTEEEAKTVPCPMGAKSHPEFKGLVLEQVAKLPDGIKVLEYLAGGQYRPNGDQAGQKAKAAARLLLEAVQPAR
jgi:recombination DNA repair RAD52 pathway protein